MNVPNFIKEAIATKTALIHPDAALYHSWVFDPRDAQVHISDDHGKPRRHKDHHRGLAEKVDHHPARIHGYAYRIIGGWRITDYEHKEVDGFVAKQVLKSLIEKDTD